MPDPCPTCGHVPEPQPSDWLTVDELALVGFLSARLAEHRDAVEAYTTGPARDVAIVAADLSASVQGVVSGFAWTRDPERRLVLWVPLLMLAQPWFEHPDCAPQWRAELQSLLAK